MRDLSILDDDLHRMRRFAMAATYMRTNGFTTPVFSFGIAAILWQWFPAWVVFSWAVVTSMLQLSLGGVAHLAMKASDDPARWRAWRHRLMVASLIAGCAFGGAILGFYLPGERLNNVLLIAVAVGSLATLAPMTSPDRGVMIVAVVPFVCVLWLVMLLHEAYPYNFILTAMAVLYCAETFMTANKLSGMVGNMVDLQIGNTRLISS